MFTTPTPTQPRDRRVAINPWLLWTVETPPDTQVLSIAELADCVCPELCDRDHPNE